MKKSILYLFLLIVALPAFSQNKIGDDCGTWRWDIKTATDEEGASILSMSPVTKSIDVLTALPRPAKVGKTDPRFPIEKELVKITGYIIEHKIVGGSGDTDYHIVVESPGKKSQLIVEIPNPECGVFDNEPDLKELFSDTRESYNEDIGTPTSKLKALPERVKVEVVGIPMWDMSDHGGGCSPNGIEIHPVISVRRIGSRRSLAHFDRITPTSVQVAGYGDSNDPDSGNNSPKSPSEILSIILLGALLGVAGQGVRIAVGLKKLNDKSESKEQFDSQFDTKKLVVSILYGVTIGIVGGIFMAVDNLDKVWDKSTIMAIIASGYAGADFIEGFMAKNLPSAKSASLTPPTKVVTGTPKEGGIPQ